MSAIGAQQSRQVKRAQARQEEGKRKKLARRHKGLKDDRASWDNHIREVVDFILPRRGRFSPSETNNGSKKNGKILNGTATKALRTLGAGMHAGITSPARPWHLLTVPDPELAKLDEVKTFLQLLADAQRVVFARSNFYNALAQFYEDLGAFGTAVMWIDEDDEDVIRCHVLPWGEYCLALDHRGRPETLFRELSLSVGQVVERFGYNQCSERVREQFDRGELDKPVAVTHCVEKRIVRDISKIDGTQMPYGSYWWETESDEDQGFLKEWGYEERPFVAARWGVTGNDTYGWGPSFDALGDTKGLQALERESAKAAAKIVDPPMKGPSSMRGGPGGPSIVPSAMNYVDSTSAGGTFEPALKIPEQAVNIFDQKIARHEIRIKETFYADLWLMLAASDRREITAREVDERHEEKMLQLGPVLVRLHDELLDPAIDRIFAIQVRKGLIPTPPDVLQGIELRVEYVSILAQAQKLFSSASTERFVALIGNVASVRPDVLDRVNWDELVRFYGDVLGIKAEILLPDEVVQKIREARQRVEAANQQMAMEAEGAEVAQKLGKADAGGGQSLLAQMTQGMLGAPAVEATA